MMNRTCVVVGCLMVATVSFAQKGDSFDTHTADYRLLLSKKIQAEVGITAAQRDALNKAADHERAVATPYLQQLQKEGKDESFLRTDPKYAGFLLELRNNVFAQLSAAQLKRLRELTLQSVDIGGVLDVIVAKKIGMSVDQLTKVRAIYDEGVKKSSAIVKQVDAKVLTPYKDVHARTQTEQKALNTRLMSERSAELKKHKPEFDQIEKQTKGKVQTVLTPAQLAAYHALQGKPFKPN
jgi:hypothetical protein